MDDDLVDEKAQVVLGKRLIVSEQELAQRGLESVGGGFCKEIGGRWSQRNDLGDLSFELGAVRSQLAQSWQHDVGGFSVCFEGFLPGGDAAIEIDQFALLLAAPLIGFLAHRARLLDHVANEIAAALDAEEMSGEVFEDHAVELCHGKALAAALFLASFQE